MDLEARKRRLEIAYEEEKIAPKLVRVNHHAEITCAQITSCGKCLSHNADVVDGDTQCGWCNGRCYDGNKDGPLVGDVCVNTYVFAGAGNNNKCPAKNEVVGTHDAPSPLSIKDGMDDDTLDVVKKHVKKDVNLFKILKK